MDKPKTLMSDFQSFIIARRDARLKELQNNPEYQKLQEEFSDLCKQMRDVLDSAAPSLFLEYEEVHSALVSFEDDAAYINGFRDGINFILMDDRKVS